WLGGRGARSPPRPPPRLTSAGGGGGCRGGPVPAALAVADLHKRFRSPLGRLEAVALDGVELEVPQGEAFGLIGPNGAGKTTFIKCLLAICAPDQGSISLLGGPPERAASRARGGYLPERPGLPRARTPP